MFLVGILKNKTRQNFGHRDQDIGHSGGVSGTTGSGVFKGKSETSTRSNRNPDFGYIMGI